MAKPKRKKTPRLADLEPAPYNEDIRDVDDAAIEALKTSVGEFGDISGITWNQRTGHLVTGHQRLRSLRERYGAELRMARGIIRLPDGERFRVRVVDWPPAKEKAANIAANSPMLAGGFTDAVADMMADVAAGLPDLADELRFDDLLAELDLVDDVDDTPDEDHVPDPPAKPTTRPGDLWTLGAHRILSADATMPATFTVLAGDRVGACLWTDPPYGVGYVGKTKDALELEGDEADGTAELLAASFAAVDPVLKPGAPVYVAHPPGRMSVVFGIAFVEQGWRLHQTLVWVKDSMVLGRSDYHYRHEPVLYGYTAGGSGRRGRGKGREGWYGGHAETSVFEYPKPHASRDHPTSKPVRLVAAMLRNSTDAGDVVVDPFLGSGSTLIAAEQLGRVAIGCDIDPRYVDVAVERWQTVTGGKAKRSRP